MMNGSRSAMRWLLVLLAAGALAGLAGLAALQPHSGHAFSLVPSITVDPDSGPPLTRVDISGMNFVPNGPYGVSFFQAPNMLTSLGTVSAEPDGTIDLNVTVPSTAVSGPAWFFVGDPFDPLATASFTVTDANGDPTEPPDDDGDGEPIGDTPAGKVELCLVTITLKHVRVVSDSPGTEIGLKIFTNRGVGTAVELTAPHDEAIAVNKVVQQFVRPKKAFPIPVVVNAKVEFTSGFFAIQLAGISAEKKHIVLCEDRKDFSLLLQLERKISFPFSVNKVDVFMDYRIDVKVIDAQ